MQDPLNIKYVNFLLGKLQSLLVLQQVFYNYCDVFCVLFEDGNKGFLINILPRQYPSFLIRNDQRTNVKNVIEILMFPFCQMWLY
jgi:hypothetical protein